VATRVGLGKVGLAPTEICFSQDCHGLVFDDSCISPLFLTHYLQVAVQEFKHTSRGTTIAGVTKKQLVEVPVWLPPFPEQRRIVAEIDKHFTRLDTAVASLQRARTNLKRYRASVLKAACEGRLVPTETELARLEGRAYEPASVLLERIVKERRARWQGQDGRRGKYQEPQAPDSACLPLLPEGWVWASVGQLVLITQNGLSKRRGDRGDPTRVLRLSDITNNKINESSPREILLTMTEIEKYRLRKGDLLSIRVNGSRDLVGRLISFASGNSWTFCDHFIRMTPDETAINPMYLSIYAETAEARRYVELNMVSSAGQNTVSQTTLLALPVPLPPLAEQQRIVAEVERHLSGIDAAENVVSTNLKRAERLRQAILQLAFQGKLVPQDPTDEPASALLERIRAERERSQESRQRRGDVVSGRSS
jgi:type I restriction enzyme S subunit